MKNLLKLQLMLLVLLLPATNNAQDLKTGEYAVQNDGSPAIIGQCVPDHIFVRNVYNDGGSSLTYDNVISFKAGTPQVVAFYLDDREIYNNAEVQALTPVPCVDGGSELYKEITYSCAQFEIYLPLGMSLIKYKFPGEKRAVEYQAGDRMPYDAGLSWSRKSENKTVDGIEYAVYTVLVTNQKNDACHFSGNEDAYADNGGALMMDDAPLFYLAIENANQDQAEGRLPDMILANQEFGIRETNINWGEDPNKCRYIYGTGGNNVEQRFQLYNRVALYGSEGMGNVLASSISLNMNNAEVIEGSSMQLSATILPNNVTNKTVIWSTSNSSVATVNSDGLVTAISPGTARIVATTTDGSNLSASCLVTVNSRIMATSITLSETHAELTHGNSMQLTATVLPNNAYNKSVIWSTTNSTVATVSDDGLVTAIAPGTALIAATTTDGSNLSATCLVTVNGSVLATSITLNETNAELIQRNSMQLTATVMPDNTTNKNVIWSTSNSSVATVSSNGLVRAIAPGTAQIIATTADGSNLSVSCTVTVKPVGSLELPDIQTTPGSEVTIPVYLQNDIPVSCFQLALFYPDGFEFVGVTKGERLIEESELSSTLKDGSCRVLALSWSAWPIIEDTGYGVILYYTFRVPDNANGTYSISLENGDYSFALTLVDIGSNYYFLDDAYGTITVLGTPATSIALNKTSATIAEGETLQLNATVQPDNVTNKSVNWTSSNSAVAMVDENGLVTAIAPGTATITATTVDGSNLSASCQVTVIENQMNYDNYLSMSDTTVMHGETIVIPVKMTNEASIISFQTDIFLPEGLELLQEDGEYIIDPSSRMTRTHSIMSNAVSNGAVRVVCYSSNYKPFTGNSGDDLFYITVKVADDAEGDYTIQLQNTLFTTSDFDELSAPTATANVNVKAYLLGDANNSGAVTVTDVVVTSQYILEMDPNPFIFEAADVNVDGNITVTDVSRIAWMVLNPTLNAPQLLRAPVLWNNGDMMHADGITLAAGETRRVSILLDNDMDYAAFQLDLELPSGLTASNFQLTDRASGHAFDVNVLQSGKIRALCYTPALTAISGHDGALLTFDVTATGTVKGDITVEGIELVTPTCQTVNLDGFSIGVNNSSAVNELSTGKSIARVDYFNLAGQQVDRPDSGVTLVVTTYTDGTRTTTKVIQ